MINVYEADNTLDAHVVLNLLEQSGIKSWIEGEDLQGGTGVIQASGLVRVMVSEDDYDEARKIVLAWDIREPLEISKTPVSNKSLTNGIAIFVIGLIFGAIPVWWIHNTPTYEDGFDHNRDGVIDEKWFFSGNKYAGIEVDRNFDKKTDVIHEYNRRGIPSTSRMDEGFDGTYETEVSYKEGQPYIVKTDTDNDGFIDMISKSKNGVLYQVVYFNPKTKLIVKRINFEVNKPVSAVLDADLNGTLETTVTYGAYENIVTTIVK